MDRRAFVAGAVSVLVAPVAAEAQPAGKVPRIGVLYSGLRGPPVPAVMEGFRQGLRGLGYVKAKNIAIE